MKVFYLSTSAFTDNQINLLHHFSGNISILYNVIIPIKNSNYSENEIKEYCLKNNIEFISSNLQYRFRDPRVLVTYYKIVATIKKVKPDVIFVANFDQIYLNALLLLLDSRKTIIAMHDVVNHSKTAFDKLTTLGKIILIHKFDKFLTYSKPQANILKEKYKKKEVYTIPLPLIDFGKMPIYAKDSTITTFLFFGNILHYKGLDILLNSINRLSKEYSNFKLIIAGRCADWNEIYEPLIQHKKVVSAHIGFIENEDIPAFFAQADYLVLPYRDTTQSGPLMIAYNYNIPVLASNAEGFNEFFDSGTTGFMFDMDKPNDIDRVLSEAIEREKSEYQLIKKKLADYVNNHFAITKLVKSYEDMFNEIVKTKHLQETIQI